MTLRDRRLFVSGLPGVWRETPLIPLSRTGEPRFALESYPFELTFAPEDAGALREARLSGPPPLFDTLPERLVREP